MFVLFSLTDYFWWILGWDTDFATEAYRQQVEALAQHQVSDSIFITYVLNALLT